MGIESSTRIARGLIAQPSATSSPSTSGSSVNFPASRRIAASCGDVEMGGKWQLHFLNSSIQQPWRSQHHYMKWTCGMDDPRNDSDIIELSRLFVTDDGVLVGFLRTAVCGGSSYNGRKSIPKSTPSSSPSMGPLAWPASTAQVLPVALESGGV